MNCNLHGRWDRKDPKAGNAVDRDPKKNKNKHLSRESNDSGLAAYNSLKSGRKQVYPYVNKARRPRINTLQAQHQWDWQACLCYKLFGVYAGIISIL